MTDKNIFIVLSVLLLTGCSGGMNRLQREFENPPNAYRPQPFWHLNGDLTTSKISEELTEARDEAGFGGVAVLPVTAQPHWRNGYLCPGMKQEFLSPEFFDRYQDILDVSEQNHTEVILYDDIDFPSGSAGGRLLKEYPQYTRKFMFKHEYDAKDGIEVKLNFPLDSNSTLMAVSAYNPRTKQVLDISSFYANGQLKWTVPAGNWKILFFTCKYAIGGVHGHLVDYMQPDAVTKVMEMTYDAYDKHLQSYFGHVINKTFFDDVGFVHMENTWTPLITEKFKEKYHRNPALYYPALFYDIGPETGAARIAFYDIRSELMAEGYVKQVSEWARVRKLQSMGHPPENYSPNTVVANGDILKFYRHVDVPLLDAILYFRRGLNGYKQICSAADLDDKPIVGAELCGAFPADMDSLMLFRTALEVMVRGVNFIVPHGMWYNSDSLAVRIPPLISPENPLLKPVLKNYSLFTGRSCLLLQGGSRVVDIAVLWPIHSVQAESYLFRDSQSGLPVANWLPDNVVNYDLSGMLTNVVHCDFTYIHPENLVSGKVSVEKNFLQLNNKENRQEYKILIMPGGDYISAEAFAQIKKFYDHGGKVISIASLPSHSAEFGRDDEVRSLVHSILGDKLPVRNVSVSNNRRGTFMFIPELSEETLRKALVDIYYEADIIFPDVEKNPAGFINYTHKVKEGNDLYYITNTTNLLFNEEISLRGNFDKIELWNPHTGTVHPANLRKENGRTVIKVKIPAVRSVFVVAKRKGI